MNLASMNGSPWSADGIEKVSVCDRLQTRDSYGRLRAPMFIQKKSQPMLAYIDILANLKIR